MSGSKRTKSLMNQAMEETKGMDFSFMAAQLAGKELTKAQKDTKEKFLAMRKAAKEARAAK